jgi:hypothetical protein
MGQLEWRAHNLEHANLRDYLVSSTEAYMYPEPIWFNIAATQPPVTPPSSLRERPRQTSDSGGTIARI